jgi:hypothetical protein
VCADRAILFTVLSALTAHAQLPAEVALRRIDDSLAVAAEARRASGLITGLGVVGVVSRSVCN